MCTRCGNSDCTSKLKWAIGSNLKTEHRDLIQRGPYTSCRLKKKKKNRDRSSPTPCDTRKLHDIVCRGCVLAPFAPGPMAKTSYHRIPTGINTRGLNTGQSQSLLPQYTVRLNTRCPYGSMGGAWITRHIPPYRGVECLGANFVWQMCGQRSNN